MRKITIESDELVTVEMIQPFVEKGYEIVLKGGLPINSKDSDGRENEDHNWLIWKVKT